MTDRLSWPDLAPPLDPAVDYSRTAERARTAALYGTYGRSGRQVAARGRREDADDLVPYWTAPAGYCRVCGDPCPTRRHRWHEDCVARYNALASGAGFRAAVWARDHGVCAACPPGTPAQPRHNGTRCTGCDRISCGPGFCWTCAPPRLLVPGTPARPPAPTQEPVGWDADHIWPLVDGGPNTMENAQTLCLPHHREKTAAEARDRATARRLRAEVFGEE